MDDTVRKQVEMEIKKNRYRRSLHFPWTDEDRRVLRRNAKLQGVGYVTPPSIEALILQWREND